MKRLLERYWTGLGKLLEKVERERVQVHLWAVELELRCRGADSLALPLRIERRRNLDRLRRYRRRGLFPRNTDFPNRFVPYLRDRQGTVCAVAHLVQGSGGAAMLERLVAQDNHARIRNVRGGPLLEWLSRSGLTQEEAACIQPSYPYRGRDYVQERPDPAPAPEVRHPDGPQAPPVYPNILVSPYFLLPSLLLLGWVLLRLAYYGAKLRLRGAAQPEREPADNPSILREAERVVADKARARCPEHAVSQAHRTCNFNRGVLY